MIFSILVLFFSAIAGGIAVQFMEHKQSSIRMPLIFAGSFLFAVTIIHILPELFNQAEDPFKIGLWVLFGFFFQQVLEYFTSGVEHGHVHATHGHSPKVSLLIALVIHSLMEGLLLNHESPFHGRHDSYSLLFGIMLHHMPAAFALMAIFRTGKKFTMKQAVILFIFAAATPMGIIASNLLVVFTADYFLILFAIVSGGFLHISTTIFVEMSPDHHFRLNRILIAVTGALVAVMAEFLS